MKPARAIWVRALFDYCRPPTKFEASKRNGLLALNLCLISCALRAEAWSMQICFLFRSDFVCLDFNY